MTDFAYLGNGSLNTVLYVTSDSPKTAGTSTNILIDNSASTTNFVLNLPTAVAIQGRSYKIRRTDIAASTNTTIVTPNGSETIGGCATWRLSTSENLTIISDGTNWKVLDHTIPTVSGYYRRKGATADRRYIFGLSYAGTTVVVTTTTLPATNTLFAFPMVVSRVTQFSVLGFEVTTVGAAGSVSRAGIYRDDGNGYPGALIFDTGSIDSATAAAIKDTTITAGLQIFQPGLYWGAWECGTNAPQIKSLTGVGGTLSSIIGSGAFSTTTSGGYGYSVAHTFGALPDPYTAAGTILNSPPSATVPAPAISIRAI